MNDASSTDNRKKLWSTRDKSWFPVEAFYEGFALLNDGTLVAVLEVVPLDIALNDARRRSYGVHYICKLVPRERNKGNAKPVLRQ